MAKHKKGAESSQALVVSLVFLVLTCIGLGVAAYAGFSDQARLEDEKNKAVSERKAIESDRDWQKFQLLQTRAYLGQTLSKDDAEALASLRKSWENGKLKGDEKTKEAVDKLLKKMDDDLGWNPDKNEPKETYLAQLTNKKTELVTTLKKFKDMEVQTRDSLKKNTDERKKDREEITLRQTAMEKVQEEAKKIKDDKSAEYLKAIKELETRAEEIDKLQKGIADEKQGLEKKIEKLTADLRTMENKYQSVVIRIAPIDLTAHDAPKGKILSLDRTGGIAYINLGSADNAKPQLTFSVYPSDAQHAKGERKAALEIVNVLQAHLSMAKFIEIRDPNRDPVMSGDQLFNPAWSSSLKQHVAIAGLIDLTGDGSDSSTEFMRNLEKQNIVVDFFLDLKDLSTRGKMTFQTNYLVMGEMPDFDATQPLKEGDPRSDRKKEILTKLSEIQTEAGRLGITIVPARRFMTLIGYKLPKTIHPPDYSLPGGMNVAAPKAEKADADKADMPKDKADMPKDKADMPKDKADMPKDKDKADDNKAKEKDKEDK